MNTRYWKDGVLVKEVRDGVEYYSDSGKTFEQLGVSVPITPIPKRITPKKEWPLWAKALKQFSKPDEDKGIGDVVARIIGEENSAAFSAWYLATFGKHCNCKGRQAKWNKLYPLNQ